MKRYLCLIISLILLTGLCSCNKSADNYDEPASFYYISNPITYFSEDSVFSFEIRETAGYRQNTLDILNAYLKGPVSDGLVSPFPDGCAALSLEWEDNTISITMNHVFAALTGIDLSIACGGVAMTLISLTGCESVKIQAEGGFIDGVNAIVLSSDNLYIFDDAATSEP